MIIYKITNRINNKIYIGQTTQELKTRWRSHNTNSNCSVLYNAIQKYGPENFTIEEIDGANSLSELNYLEEHYIYINDSMTPNGYNIKKGGNNKRIPEETKIKIGNANRGRFVSEKTKNKLSQKRKNRTPALGHSPSLIVRNKISLANKGKKRTQETKKKLSDSAMGNTRNLGKKHSNETIEKMRNTKLGKKHTEETKAKISETKNYRHT